MMALKKILHLEDNISDAELVKTQLKFDGIKCTIFRVESKEDFTDALTQNDFDLIISDYTLPSFYGKEALIIAKEMKPEIPFIFLSGTMGEVIAVESLHNGATDYIIKENLSLLTPSIKRALQEADSIKKRKSAEDALFASESKFRDLFNNMSSGVAVYKAIDGGNDFIFLDLNLAGQKSVGVDINKVRGKKSTDVFPALDEIGLLEVMKRVWLTGEPEIQPATFYKDDRISFWLETYIYKLVTGEIVAVYDDITLRKNAEIAMKASEEKFRNLVNHSPNGIYLADENGKCLFVNPTWCKMAGLTEEEALGDGWIKGLHPDDVAPIFEKWNLMIENGEDWDHEYRFNNPEIGVTMVSGRITQLFDSSGKLTGYIGTNVDITERKQIEESLKKSQDELRSLTGHLHTVREEERASIAREIHDELGQVLTSLKMNLAIMKKELVGKQNIESEYIINEMNGMSDIIDTSVGRVRKLITSLRPELLDKLGLIPALEWQIEEFQQTSKIECGFKSNIEELNIAPSKSIVIYRVLQEALTNIGRHSGATKAEIEIIQQHNSLEMIINDNGKGFDPDESKNGKSFGLIGMRERATLINGRFNIESAVGKGTSIVLHVAIKDE